MRGKKTNAEMFIFKVIKINEDISLLIKNIAPFKDTVPGTIVPQYYCYC